jgi:cytochrome b
MRVLVWPWWVRLLHWVLAVAIIAALVTHHGGRLHEIGGYVALAAALARSALGFIGPAESRFSAFVHGPAITLGHARALLKGVPERRLGHTPLGGWMIVTLLTFAVAGGVSGAIYVTDRFWGEAWMIGLHAATTWVFAGLVPLHVAGVLHASWIHRENLVHAMIDGRKEANTRNDVQ